jgi:hypothetical protein
LLAPRSYKLSDHTLLLLLLLLLLLQGRGPAPPHQ